MPDSALNRSEVDSLLSDLCIRYGFCLPPVEQDKLLANPPQEVKAFVDAVFVAEGLDPETVGLQTYRAVRDRIAQSFARATERAEYEMALKRSSPRR